MSAQPNAPSISEFDLVELWRAVVQYKYLIVASAFILGAIGTALAFTAHPVYQAHALLAPSEGSDARSGGLAASLGGLTSLVGIPAASAPTNEKNLAIAILQSRDFLAEFIDDNDLLPILFAGLWNEDSKTWNVENPIDVPIALDGASLFQDKILAVREDNSTGFVTLQVSWGDPLLAADWLTRLVERLNSEMRNRAIAQAEERLDYLAAQLSSVNEVEIRQVIFGLMEAQIKARMLATVRDEYAFSVIDPPVVPRPDEFVHPNRPLLVAGGFGAGTVLGFVMAIMVRFLSVLRHGKTATPV